MSQTKDKPEFYFKTNPRVPLLLGDELIPDPGYALFELVKNAWDADATDVTIIMRDIDTDDGIISIRDNGSGMNLDTIKNVWLTIGTTMRLNQSEKKENSPIFNRPRLGAKGIGRLAVHKLGEEIQLVTRAEDNLEYIISINWKDYEPDKNDGYGENEKELSDIPVTIEERDPILFKGENTGTRIRIKQLRQKWTKSLTRQLHRTVQTITSPWEFPEDFYVKLIVKTESDWLKNLGTAADFADAAPFKATCWFENDGYEYEYEFVPVGNLPQKAAKRSTSDYNEYSKTKHEEAPARDPYALTSEELRYLRELTPFTLEMNMYELSPTTLDAIGQLDRQGLKSFLKENGGVRVYRNGIRVFGLGGEGEDWLDLGGRRVLMPSKRLSNNQVFGAVLLEGGTRTLLQEQTNRQGFVQNTAFFALRKSVIQAITQIEAERLVDKDRIRELAAGKKVRTPVVDELQDLRIHIESQPAHIRKEFEPFIDRLDSQYQEVMERLVLSSSAGLHLSTALHEANKRIDALYKILQSQTPDISRVRRIVADISHLLDGFSLLIKKSSRKYENLKELADDSIFNFRNRFIHHNITVINAFKNIPDQKIRCIRRLVVSAIMNLLDNSAYWLKRKGAEDKSIWVGPVEHPRGPAIAVADNGPGFKDPPEFLIKPFFSRKDEGSGLGLYITDHIMRQHGGQLEFPEQDEYDIPPKYDGATAILVFNEVKL